MFPFAQLMRSAAEEGGINDPNDPANDAFYSMAAADISGSTLIDLTGNGYDGTINGATSVANALSFDGTNDEVTSLFANSGTNFSGTLWFNGNASATGTIQVIYGQGGTPAGQSRLFALDSSNNQMYFNSRNSSGSAVNVYLPFTPDIWNHVYFEQLGTALRLRLNDSTENTGATSGLYTGFQSTGIMGRRPDASSLWYAGDAAKLVLRNRGLTAEEITQSFNDGPPV